MPTPFNSIKMIWRPRPHAPRLVVGTLTRDAEGRHTFLYDGPDVEQAQLKGFQGYPGMPMGATYNGQAMSAFAARLVSRERPDYEQLVGGWGVFGNVDDFELLGRTFGTLPTDMFEFIPEVFPLPGVRFHSDLAGLQNYATAEAFRELSLGTALQLASNPANEFDCHAVEVLHEGNQVAHIKRIHNESICRAFRAGVSVSCRLIRAQVNGVIKEVVVEVAYS